MNTSIEVRLGQIVYSISGVVKDSMIKPLAEIGEASVCYRAAATGIYGGKKPKFSREDAFSEALFAEGKKHITEQLGEFVENLVINGMPYEKPEAKLPGETARNNMRLGLQGLGLTDAQIEAAVLKAFPIKKNADAAATAETKAEEKPVEVKS